MAAPLFLAATTLWACAVNYWPGPFMDQWASVQLLRQVLAEGLTFEPLFRQHNEHRILFARLVILADFWWFDGRNVLTLAVNGVAQLLGGVLFVVAYARGPRGPIAVLALALALSLIASLRQWENLFWGFQLCFVCVFAAGAWASYLFFQATADRARLRWGVFAAAMLLLVFATFNLANGVLAGAAMTVGGLLTRRAPLAIGAAAAATGALLAVYLHGYTSVAAHSPVALALAEPGAFLAYLAAYLGNIWAPNQPVAAAAAGAVGLALTAAMTLTMWRAKTFDAARAGLFGVVLFMGATAAVTALGRVGFGLEQALVPRYATPSAYFWAAHALFWASLAPARAGAAPRAAAAIGLVALMAVLLPVQVFAYQELRGYHERLLIGSSALMGEVDDPEALKAIYPTPELPRAEAPLLRQRRLALFARSPQLSVGDRFRPAEADPGRCRGAFDILEPAPGGAPAGRALGWAWDTATGRGASDVILVDEAGRVVGLGLGGVTRADVARALRRPGAGRSGWIASVRPTAGEMRAYALLEDGRACEIGRRAWKAPASADVTPPPGSPASSPR